MKKLLAFFALGLALPLFSGCALLSSDEPPSEAPTDPNASADWDATIARRTNDLALAYLGRAAAAAKAKHYGPAASDLGSVLLLFPHHDLARLARAQLAFENVDNRLALSEIDILLAAKPAADAAPDDPINQALRQLLSSEFPGMRPNLLADAWQIRGNIRQASGNLSGALADFTAAIEADPDFAAAYNSRGIVFGLQGDADKAVADFTAAARIEPDAPDAYANRAHVAAALRHWDDALHDLTHAIELKPDWATGYFDRADVRRQSGDPDGAVADWSKAIELKADYTDAYFNRALTYDRRGEVAKAIADYGKIAEQRPDWPDVYLNRGIDHYRQKEMDLAIKDLTRSLELKPGQIKALLIRAVAERISGDTEASLTDFARVIQIADVETAVYPHLFRAAFYHQLHPSQIQTSFQTTIAGWPRGWPKSVGEYLLGTIPASELLARAGTGPASVALPRRCDAYYFLGLSNLAFGRRDDARDCFAQSVATERAELFSYRLAESELAALTPAPSPADASK